MKLMPNMLECNICFKTEQYGTICIERGCFLVNAHYEKFPYKCSREQ